MSIYREHIAPPKSQDEFIAEREREKSGRKEPKPVPLPMPSASISMAQMGAYLA